MDKGIELIKKWEGLRLNAYKCPAGVWTIGYGSTRINGQPVRQGQRLKSEAEADKLLRESIKNEFLPELQKIPVWRQLNRNQQGALLSFAYNLGARFYGASGFETITRVLKNGQFSEVPEAMMLYVKANGKTLQGLVNRRKEEGLLWLEPVISDSRMIDLIKYPEVVGVNERLTIIGKYYGEPDATLKVMADGKFKLPDCKVQDGVIDYGLTLNTPGDRLISFSFGKDKSDVLIKIVEAVESKPLDPQPVDYTVKLSGSVGNGGVNRIEDVKQVQAKLKVLGYSVGNIDGIVGQNTIKQIRLFQSIINGQTRVSGDGRVDVNGKTNKWLNARHAPRWQTMPNSNPEFSFRNQELEETWDKHDYGTSWMATAILWIASHYHTNYRSKTKGSSPFSINDVSLSHGGDTPDHSGHETGLCCDVYLPRKDGLTGGIDYLDSRYDRAATEAILKSINQCPMVNKSQIYFNDPYLVQKGLCKSVRGHHHHIHFGVKVPILE